MPHQSILNAMEHHLFSLFRIKKFIPPDSKSPGYWKLTVKFLWEILFYKVAALRKNIHLPCRKDSSKDFFNMKGRKATIFSHIRKPRDFSNFMVHYTTLQSFCLNYFIVQLLLLPNLLCQSLLNLFLRSLVVNLICINHFHTVIARQSI